MKQAVCILIVQNDKVLAVARRGTTDQFGLPGGKVDDNECLIDAIIRETKEETEIVLDPNHIKTIFASVDDDGYKTTTFFYDKTVNTFKQGDAGPVAFVTWEKLESGPFADYNKALHEAYKYFIKYIVD